MRIKYAATGLVSLWAAAAVLAGTILTSYHQPFQVPDKGILRLIRDSDRPGWLALHVLSSSCGCSERVMRHLVHRGLLPGVNEQVLLIDDAAPKLAGADALVSQLSDEGFSVSRIEAKDLPSAIGLRGVPLLVLVSSGRKIEYEGGYGTVGDQVTAIFEDLNHGRRPEVRAVLGCAIGSALRRRSDPFRLKY